MRRDLELERDVLALDRGAEAEARDRRAAGGGKETNIGAFLNDVDNDQRMEIVRMYGLLGRPVEWS